MAYLIPPRLEIHVAFKGYVYPDDNFRMGNMIAVRDESLRAMLVG